METSIQLTEQEGGTIYTRKASKTQVRLMRAGIDNHSGGKTTKTGSVKRVTQEKDYKS